MPLLPARDEGNMNMWPRVGKARKNGLGHGCVDSHLYLHPVAAVTNYHKLSGLFILQSWKLEVQHKEFPSWLGG